MVTLDEAVVVRFKSHGSTFEVLVEPDLALSLRHGEEIPLQDILAVEDVFEDAGRGERPSEESIQKAFGTTNVEEIARKIILEGEFHLTTEQRRRLQEEKRLKVANFIARNAVNPQTHTPHPPQRIQQAMKEAGVHIDPMKSVDELVKLTMKAIRPVIPIRFEEVRIAVKVPPEFAARSYGSIQSFASLEREEWQDDGSWIGVVKMPAGMQEDFYRLVNKLTRGEAETKLIK